MFRIFEEMISQSRSIVCRPEIAPQWVVRNNGARSEYHGVFVLSGEHGKLLMRLPGRVVEWPGLPLDVYIYDPPPAVRRHRHGHCLQLLSPNSRWFKLHWEKPARNFDQARAYVEQMLHESLAGTLENREHRVG